MLEELVKFQLNNNIELEYYFKGTHIIVTNLNFAELNAPMCFDLFPLDNLKETILSMKENLTLSNDYDNVVPLNAQFKNITEELDEIPDNVIFFPNKKPQIQLTKSDPNELARAVLCINNIGKPVHEQDENYKKLHKYGICSYYGYKE